MHSSSFSTQIEQEDVTSIVDNDFLEGSVSTIETSEAIGRSLEGKLLIEWYLKNVVIFFGEYLVRSKSRNQFIS